MEKRKYTYKLYPNAKQSEALLEHLRLHQQLYNAALQERIDFYQKTGKTITYNEQQASLTQIRKDFPEYKAIACTSERMTLRRLDKAFKGFFRRLKKGEKPGFPRYKSLTRFSSFELLDTKFTPNQKWKHGKLFIKGIGHIKARGQARQGGTIKTSQVKYQHGKWWLSLTIECEPLRNCKQQKAGGLNWGVEYLASITDDDGTVHQIDNPKYHNRSKSIILPLEQAIYTKKKGSQRWRKACKKLSQAKAKIARQRADTQHKLSKNIAENYALVATEKLTIESMARTAKELEEKSVKGVAKKSRLKSEILDTAPAQLVAMIRYKVEETGGEFIELKPSPCCPLCWTIKKKALSDRHHTCDCGCSMPGDAASALVAVRLALGLGQELAEAGNSAKPLLSEA